MVRIDGKTIRSLREAKGLTQLYLASFVGVTTDTVSRWENGKTQTIKKENLERLAEALEVAPEELLPREEEEENTSPTQEEHGNWGNGKATSPPQAASIAGPTRRWGLVAAAVLGAMALVALLLWNRPPGPRPSVQRWLPDHAPPGASFPVMLELSGTQGGQAVNVMITEHLPPGVKFVASTPSPVKASEEMREIKWIAPLSSSGVKVVYAIEMETGAAGQINGDLLLRIGGEKRILTGPSLLPAAAPYHWADQDRDGAIDDGELLTALDILGDSAPLARLRQQVERIWSAGRYRWNPAQHDYEVKP